MQGYKRRAKRVAELCQFGYHSRSDDFAIGIETAGEPRSCEPVHLSHEALLAYVQRMTATLTAQACSDRPYRRGMPVAQAAAILRAGRGTQWEAALVDAFLRTLPVPQDAPVPAVSRTASTTDAHVSPGLPAA